MTITAVVFDLGGVLIDWDPRYLYRRLLPAADVEPFLDEIGFAQWNHLHDAGGSWAEGVAELSARHPHHRELIEAYPQRFLETLGGSFPATVDLLRELHGAGVRLLALTNWSAETFRVARTKFPFLDLFDDIVVSGEEGVAKPDPRIFRILLERNGLDPANTVFIDDSAANVAAAGAIGLAGVRYENPTKLRERLVGLGVLRDPTVAPSGPSGDAPG